MKSMSSPMARSLSVVLCVLSAGACGPEGPAVDAAPQTISFVNKVPSSSELATISVAAVASSGLPVRYRSLTPGICAVDSAGQVTGLASGICTVAVDQAGDEHWAPAAQVTCDIVFDLGQASGSPTGIGFYRVVATFYEPDTQPNNTVFVGTFTFDASTGTVTDLRGTLSECMTGGATPYPNDTMEWLVLDYQLSSLPVTIDGVNGLLVTTFRLPTTATLAISPSYAGSDGWEPGSGMGLHYGYPGDNPGNAYVRIFVNTTDPAAGVTPAQVDQLAYADCAPGGMMGATCMTGTSAAVSGSVGTMGGYPVSQVITRR